MKNINSISSLCVALMACAMLAATSTEASAQQQGFAQQPGFAGSSSLSNGISVTLRPTKNQPAVITAGATTVLIGDIAEVHGGSPEDRQRVSQLDLETLRSRSHQCQISRSQVEMRILIDGFRRSQFSVSGPSDVLVGHGLETPLGPRLEGQLANEIGRQFALDPETVSVRLSSQQQIQTVQKRLGARSFTTTVLLGSQLPMGQTPISVEFATDDGKRFVERFDSQVIIEMQVALAKQPIERGATLDASMFDVVKRPIIRKADFAVPGRLAGHVAKRSIASNEVILRTYLAEPSQRKAIVIRRNDLLDVIVPLGRTEVRLKNARSLSDGDVGDTITVVNTRSNRQLSAIVVDRNLARVVPLTGGTRR